MISQLAEALIEGLDVQVAIRFLLEGATHTVSHEGRAVQFTTPRSIGKSKLYVPVMLDVQKVERSWQRDRGFHIGPGGTENSIGTRYDRFGEFLKSGVPIEGPEVSIGHAGHIVFTNGRHRFAYLRDRGLKHMPFWVDRFQAGAIRKHFGSEES